MKNLIRALSVRQPWAELTLSGERQAECRSRPTNVPGRVLVYASLTPSDNPTAWNKVGNQPGELPSGQIVGIVEITAGQAIRARHAELAPILARTHLSLSRPVRKATSAGA
jgi:ASCH domain-containing protein